MPHRLIALYHRLESLRGFTYVFKLALIGLGISAGVAAELPGLDGKPATAPALASIAAILFIYLLTAIVKLYTVRLESKRQSEANRAKEIDTLIKGLERLRESEREHYESREAIIRADRHSKVSAAQAYRARLFNLCAKGRITPEEATVDVEGLLIPLAQPGLTDHEQHLTQG